MQSLFSRCRRTGLAVLSIISALLASAVANNAVAAPECMSATVPVPVATVPDPRSVASKDGRVLRLAGIESFALLHPDAAASDAALRSRIDELVSGSEVRVQLLSETHDRYGRIPALLTLRDGRFLQEVLVGEGLAIALATSPAMPCFDRLLAAEDDARRSERGFWAQVSVPKARPEALAGRIGRFTIMEGRVVSVGIRRSATYLNFGERWSQDVTVEVRGRDRDLFIGNADLAGMSGQRIRVRGFLEERSGPAMIVNSPTQIEVLGTAAGPNGAESDGGRP